ncbi:hypothetical protein Tco_0084666 [Tanacetum coccineum]
MWNLRRIMELQALTQSTTCQDMMLPPGWVCVQGMSFEYWLVEIVLLSRGDGFMVAGQGKGWCAEGDVVLRHSYKPESCGKLYYACPKSKRTMIDIEQFSFGGENLFLRLSYAEIDEITDYFLLEADADLEKALTESENAQDIEKLKKMIDQAEYMNRRKCF